MKQEHSNRDNMNVDKQVKSVYGSLDAPEHLWQRVRVTADARERSARARKQSRITLPYAPQLVATLCMLAVLVAWLLPWESDRTRPQQSLPTELASEFATFLASGRDFDVKSSNAEALQAWFSSRLEEPLPPAPPIDGAMTLAGGRLCQIRRSRVVSYVYLLDGTVVALYITRLKESGEVGPVPGVKRLMVSPQSEFAYSTWSQNGWRYSLIANLPNKEAADIAARFVGQRS